MPEDMRLTDKDKVHILLQDNGQAPASPTTLFSEQLQGEFRSSSQLFPTNQQLSVHAEHLTIPSQRIYILY